jgi:hypothetical protein
MIFTVVSVHQADTQHDNDSGQITALKKAVDQANDTQKANAKTFSDAFTQLSDKVAKLQTQAATEALQKQAAQLQDELRSTQQTLNPPKAELAFTFEAAGDVALRTTHITPDKDGNITFKFTAVNASNADALDGFIILTICDACTFVKEPVGFHMVDGARSTQRNYNFQHIFSYQYLPLFETTIRPPADAPMVIVGIDYRCKTCIVPRVVNNRVPEIDRGTIYISARTGN